MSIRDFNVEESQSDGEENTDNKYVIDTIHKKVGSEGMPSISLKEESGGNLKMFALYPSVKEVLDKGATLFVDELNAGLQSHAC